MSASPQSHPAPETPRILARQGVAARDGVELVTDVYLPAPPGPHPAVLLRTPYGRTAPFLLRLASRLGKEGLAVVLQDCRGRNGSGGEADWRREDADGHDTLAWLGERSWCDGRVGLLGISVTSLSAFHLAAEEPPEGVELRALANVAGLADPGALFHRTGALVLHWALPWLHLMARRETSRGLPADWPWQAMYRALPLAGLEPRGGLDPELWRRIVAGGEAADWLGGNGHRGAGPAVPILHVAGWQDFLLAPTLAAYRETAAAPGSAALVVGPWDHQSLFAGGELVEALAAWFARWLLPAAAPRNGHLGAYLRLSESEGWRGFESFPPEEAEAVDLYLAAGGGAEASPGDGRLAAAPPRDGGADRYRYDPADPVPTVGGALWPFPAAGLRPGLADASAVEARDDVLVYTGETLDRDLVLAGPVAVELWVATSAPATDFTASLTDVDPEGTPWLVQDGIVRLPPANGVAAAAAARPVRIDLAAAGHRFRKGHRLRLQVSSSNFPKYDRHLNGAGVPALAEGAAVAEQTVFHGGATPSRLRLTVLPERAAGRTVELARGLAGRAAAGGAGRRLRDLLRERLALLGRRFRAGLETQTARPRGPAGRLVGVFLLLANRGTNRRACELLEARPGDQVLEIGFGPGDAVRRLVRGVPGVRVAGIDHSETMLRLARRRNGAAIGRGQVNLRRGEVSSLPFPERSFDRVLAVNSVQLWPRMADDLREVRRVLRPDGRVVLSFSQPRWVLPRRELEAAARRLRGQLTAAGFIVTAHELRRMGPVHGFFIAARRPADPPKPAAGG